AAADRNKRQKLPWLQDIVLTILTTFGGALVAPTIVGEPPAIFVNELLLPAFLTAWFLIVHMGDTRLTRFLSSPWVKRILTTAAAASTANSICSLTDKGAKKFTKGSILYPTAFFGPWLVGVVRGSAAAFLPLDKGLGALGGGVPFSMQLAAFSAALYQLTANDPYVIGGVVRGMLMPLVGAFGAAIVAPLNVRLIIITLYMTTTFIRSFDSYKDFNVFAPVHHIIYAVTGIPPSGKANGVAAAAAAVPAVPPAAELAARHKKERAFDILRYGAVMAVVASVAVGRSLPADTLAVGGTLKPGEFLGTCTLLPAWRGCQPYVATLGVDGALAVFRGKSPDDPHRVLQWSSPAPRKASADVHATLAADGRIAVVSEGKAVWQSTIAAAPAGGHRRPPGAPFHANLRPDGTLAVVEGGSDVWVSA
ncbi:unnamed protein product, partial [Phaeothamnion confervicola]